MAVDNKNIRKLLAKYLKVIRRVAPKEVADAANLANLDGLDRILRERQSEAKQGIQREFEELLTVAYVGVILFGFFSFELEFCEGEVFPSEITGEVTGSNLNHHLAGSFATISNNSLAVINLIKSGLEFPARSLMRVFFEHCWLTLVIISDKEKLATYRKAQDVDEARKIWYQSFKPQKVNRDLNQIEASLFKEKDDFLHSYREHLYSFYTMSVHTTAIVNTLGCVGTSFDDHNVLKPAQFGYPSASSVVVLKDLCFGLIYTYSMFFRIVEHYHGIKVPTKGELMPFLQAMRWPFTELLSDVFKYDDYLKHCEDDEDA